MVVAGCSSQPQSTTTTEDILYVPSSAIVNSGRERLMPNQILPAWEGDVLIARAEKTAYGSIPLAGISAFTLYSYDAQPTYIRHSGGTGYRYRWVWQQGVSGTLAP